MMFDRQSSQSLNRDEIILNSDMSRMEKLKLIYEKYDAYSLNKINPRYASYCNETKLGEINWKYLVFGATIEDLSILIPDELMINKNYF